MKMLFGLLFSICLGTLLRAQDSPDSGFISIDCGAPNAYTDDKLLIRYETDAGFIHSGQNMQVATNYINQMPQLTNLRSFPDGKRNCYTLRPKQGNSNRYLIRASFYYGNYDLRSQTPKFDLYIDVNYWTTIKNTANYTYEEIIHTTSRDYIHVCLVNTGSGVPFISVLELRTLVYSTYNTTSGALVLFERSNIGSSTTYRYPQDPYDRIWEGKNYGIWTVITNTTNVDSLKSNNDAYKVPTEVLMTAHQSINSSYGMSLSWTSSNSSNKWCVFLHFAEIQILRPGKARQLSVHVNDDASVTTVLPEYLKPVTVPTLPFDGTNLSISVYSATESNLSAFFNAVEIFKAIDLPNSPTDLNNVNAMTDIKSTYGVFGDVWQGDPCVPLEFTWRGLTCNEDHSPKITSLNMSSSGLKGTMAAPFSNLTALESLDLSFNDLTGPLPEFLAFLPNLRVLNLSGNNLNGRIPEALKQKSSRDKTFRLSLDGNPDLCLADPCSGDKKKRTILPVAIGVASAILVLILCVIAGVCMMRRRRQGGAIAHETRVSTDVTKSSYSATSSKDVSVVSDGGTMGIVSKNRPFTSTEISVMTRNFNVIIGEGGFGNVYLGTLKGGTKVAVKVLSPSSRQGYKEFRAEAQLLMIVHHKNLVSLVGYCDEVENMSLVYEYMSNGNLRQHLSEQRANVLSWSKRLEIGVDAAQGLEYLHNGCRPPIVHRDLKTSNILLNDRMQAKIGDFGLSRAFVTDLDSHVSTRPAGTPGYLDPVFNMSGSLNTKSDVYSFGVILLELITGRPAIIRDLRGSTHILQWVTPFIERGDIQSIVDPRVHGQFDTNSAWKAVEIATQCVQLTSIQRPDISRILSDLKACLAVHTRHMMGQAVEAGTTMGSSFEMTSLELDIAPRAR